MVEGRCGLNDKQKAARAIGYLEGMSALWWTFVGERLSDETVAAYEEAVETLRKAIDWGDAE